MGLLRCISRQNGRLDSSTISNGLIRVDTLVGLFAIEEIGHELDDTGNARGPSNEDNLVNIGLVYLRIAKDLLDGLQGTTEKILAQFLEPSPSQRGIEINALKERIDLDRGLGC